MSKPPPIPLKDMGDLPFVFQDWFRRFQFGYTSIFATAEPNTPPVGQFIIYMDQADNKLKAKGPSGTVTNLANP